jgi:hypothetical protein
LLGVLSNEVEAEYSASVQPLPTEASGPRGCATWVVVVPGVDWLLLLAAGPTLGPPAEAHPAAVISASAGSTANRSHLLPRSL